MKTFKQFKKYLILEAEEGLLAPYWDRLEKAKRNINHSPGYKKAYGHALDLFNWILDDFEKIKKSGKLQSFLIQIDAFLKAIESNIL